MKSYWMSCSVVLMLSLSVSVQALLIDDFTDVQEIVVRDTIRIGVAMANDESSMDVTGSLFDRRKFITSVSLNPDNQDAMVSAGTGVLSIAKGPNTLAQWWIEWESDTPVDLTEQGNLDYFQYQILENNAAFVDLEFYLSDGTQSGTVLINDVLPIVSGQGSDVFTLRFADFTNADLIDFGAITRFELYVNGEDSGNGADLQFDFVNIEADVVSHRVPVPATIALMSIGLLGLCRMARSSSRY